MRSSQLAWFFSIIVVLTMAGPVARADDASEARLQYELGSELYSQRRFAEALERFIASNRLVPNANVVFNIAQTYQLMDRPVEAYNWFETYLGFTLEDDARRNGEQLRDALVTRVAVVDVRTEPAGATLYVDRRDLGAVGRSPRRVAVEAGQRRILAALDRYSPAETTVEAVRGRVTTSELTLQPLMGALVVETQPPGATVRAQGRADPLGTTPLSVSVPVDTYQLTIELPGHAPVQREIRVVESAQPTAMSIELTRSAGSAAILSVQGSPVGASVLIDGEEVGTTPLTVPDLQPRRVELEVRAEGHESYSEVVTLEPGGATRLRYELADPSERAWSGWWWLGYGGGAAVFATGAVMGLVASSERSAFFDEPSSDQYDSVKSLSLAADVLMITGLVTLATTLVIDLLSDPPAESRGRVTLDR